MEKVKNFLSGKKTYVIGLAFVLLAVCGWMGWEIPANLSELLAGAGLITLRAGVAKK